MSELRELVGAIPASSKTVIALIEFLFLVWIWYRYREKTQVIREIGKLAPEVQLEALRMHFGEAPLKSKLGSRDWMRDRMMRQLITPVLVVIFVAATLIALFLPAPSPRLGETPPPEPLPPKQAAVPTAVVSFFSQPDKANLQIDGQWVGLTATTGTLSEGQHNIVFTKEGYKPHNDIISVPQQKTVAVVLEER